MQWRQPEEGQGPQSSGDWGERSGWMDGRIAWPVDTDGAKYIFTRRTNTLTFNVHVYTKTTFKILNTFMSYNNFY